MATVRKVSKAKSEAALASRISEITMLIAELDTKLEELAEKQRAFLRTSYVSQKVHHKALGEGIVVEQKEDILHITFLESNVTKAFVMHRKFANRPVFENDEEVISEFTEFGNIRQTIIQLKQEKARLEKERAVLLAELPH